MLINKSKKLKQAKYSLKTLLNIKDERKKKVQGNVYSHTLLNKVQFGIIFLESH